MSLHSQFVDIRYLEAEHHNPSHNTIFRLPNGIQAFPNLRLGNLGIHGAVGALSKTGISSLIKHIYLYSDRQLIDQARYANHFESFRQLTMSNSSNKNIFRFLEKHQVGYLIDSKEQVGPDDTLLNNSVVNSTEKDAQGGYLQLPMLLQILQEPTFIIDTNKFPNLTLVIEWETDKRKYLSAGCNNNYTIGKPTLIYDEITDPKIGQQASAAMKNFNWNCIEHDAIDVHHETILPRTQTLHRKLKGFDNKLLNRLILIKNFQNVAHANDGTNAYGKGYYRSPVQHLEQINLKINGRPIFDEPLSQEETRQAITAQAWGKLNIQPYESSISVGVDNPETKAQFIGISSDETNVTGMASYLGCRIDNVVQDFEIEYKRTCPTDNATIKRYSEALVLNVFGEVTKQLVFGKDGQFIVRYV